MRYVDEFRDGALAKGLARSIAAEADSGRTYRLMEFCGGHTHAIYRYGVQDLMPANLRFVHGPGCPVCVLPMARIDQAIAMAVEHGVTLCTYGDLMRVPASERNSLLKAKAAGADIRMIYSTQDALAIARAPGAAGGAVRHRLRDHDAADRGGAQGARAEGLENFSVFCNHVLTPPALAHHPGHANAGRVVATSACSSTASSVRRTSAPSSAAGPMSSCRRSSASRWSSPASSRWM
jgi:hydrogenase expression/formation protein HypD